MADVTLFSLLHGLALWIGEVAKWLINLTGIKEIQFIGDWAVTGGPVNFLAILLTCAIFMVAALFVGLTFIWGERKVLGRIMDRRGTQVGMLGLFQNFADGIKTLLKEFILPRDSDKKLFLWSVTGLIASSVLLLGLVPWSTRFFVANPELTLLIGLAVFSLAPFFILICGWAANNKYTVIGGMRAAAQLIAYEIPVLLVVVSIVIMTGSLNFNEIVAFQQNHTWLLIPLFIGFVTFFTCGIAETERVPFDLPEAEAELVEGWQTEYGGIQWGLVMMSDYLRAYVVSALITVLFLGGWDGPFLIPEVWFLIKVFLVFFVMIWVRSATVRIRTDQLLKIGWRRLLPLSVINLGVAVVLKAMGWF
ncbi:MAG: complex I subunit 1 family protein [Methanomassiliicoccales archaeon]|jgi:NADH-quinone oxidoreductase subunit H